MTILTLAKLTFRTSRNHQAGCISSYYPLCVYDAPLGLKMHEKKVIDNPKSIGHQNVIFSAIFCSHIQLEISRIEVFQIAFLV